MYILNIRNVYIKYKVNILNNIIIIIILIYIGRD